MKSRIKRKIQNHPWLYDVGRVFKACNWVTSIERRGLRWTRSITGVINRKNII